nr:Chain P, MODIFIED ANTIGEN TN [Homo sapiens]
APDCRP